MNIYTFPSKIYAKTRVFIKTTIEAQLKSFTAKNLGEVFKLRFEHVVDAAKNS